MIPNDAGVICGKQIGEGEAIGTVIINGPVVGHKKCADGFHARKQQSEREARHKMVKRYDQGGAGGPIDYNSERDGIQGSLPLEKPEPAAESKAEAVVVSASLKGSGGMQSTPDLASITRAAGVHSIADVPLDASPDEAVEIAERKNAEEYKNFLAELRTTNDKAPLGGVEHVITVPKGIDALHLTIKFREPGD